MALHQSQGSKISTQNVFVLQKGTTIIFGDSFLFVISQYINIYMWKLATIYVSLSPVWDHCYKSG